MVVNKQIQIPVLLERLLKLFLSARDQETISADLGDYYFILAEEKNTRWANIWYIVQILKIVKGKLFNALFWSGPMFKNYLKITFRNFKRYKGYSFINVAGLVVGMVCFILILLYVRYELNYDKYYENSDRIYRVVCELPSELGSDRLAITPAPFAPALKDDFPEVESATRFSSRNRLLLTKDETSFYERGLFADEHFFKVFSFKLIKGEKKHILQDLESIVISQRLADKFFGNQNPIGQFLECSLGKFPVVGIVENVPENSHIQFDWLIPFARQFNAGSRARRLAAWNWDDYYTYTILNKNSKEEDFENKFNTFTKSVYDKSEWPIRSSFKYSLQPMKSTHLTSGFRYELSATTDIDIIRLFSAVGIFILLIACFNAMNLMTAQASKRFKEIGIRKTVGAQRFQLFRQFTGESFFISTIVFVIAIVLVIFFLPLFNQFVERSIELKDLLNLFIIYGIMAAVLGTGLLSGLYPALFLSLLKPSNILKQKIGNSNKGINLRNVLVLFQFSVTIILIISSFIIFRQIKYIQNKDLGFNREQVVVIRKSDPGIWKNYQAFKNSILANPAVIDLTTSSQLPTNISSATGRKFKMDDGKEKLIHYQWMGVDYNFIDVFGMEIIKGRNFSKKFGADTSEAIIINETFVNSIGWANPIGKQVPATWGGGDENRSVVVGVVKDIYARSLHLEKKPVVFGCRPGAFWVHVRIRSDNISKTLSHIENVYNQFKTRFPNERFFLDDQFNQMYRSEVKLGQMLVYFSGLAIFIACLGIFGLSTYTAERRTKEIGVRKVLGASISGIIFLFSREFTKWVLISNIIAWPIAYIGMKNWLQNFVYHVNLELWIFFVSALLALLIAILSTSYQSIKAAIVNPVDSLKYE